MTNQNTNPLSKGFPLLLIVFSFSLPLLRPSWHNALFGIVILAKIIQIRKSNPLGEFKHFVLLIYLSGVQCILGLLYSLNITAGLSFIETQVPLFIMPLIIFSTQELISSVEIKRIFSVFIAGVIILTLACLAFISQDLWDYKNLQANLVIANYSLGQIHPVFLSLYISFGILFLIDEYFPVQTKNRSRLGWILFSSVILVTFLIWINSRTGILSFSIAIIFYSFYRFNTRARVVSLSIVVVFIIILFLIPFSRERFIITPQLALRGELSINSQDPNIYPLVARKQIVDCSLELLNGHEFFIGYGTGDFRDVLRECYKTKNYNSLFERGLDSHNEYFAQTHRHGIVGLLIFVVLLVVPFRYALKYRSPLLASFIVLFAITAMFENVFSAQKGVTFFAVFCPLLMLYARKKYESGMYSGKSVGIHP